MTGTNESINPGEIFAGKNRYVLEARGESMADIGIMDGDFVVIQQREDSRNGEIVVALIDRKEATLKRFYRHPDGRIELRPENSTMETSFYEPGRVQIQGKMVGLFRSY